MRALFASETSAGGSIRAGGRPASPSPSGPHRPAAPSPGRPIARPPHRPAAPSPGRPIARPPHRRAEQQRATSKFANHDSCHDVVIYSNNVTRVARPNDTRVTLLFQVGDQAGSAGRGTAAVRTARRQGAAGWELPVGAAARSTRSTRSCRSELPLGAAAQICGSDQRHGRGPGRPGTVGARARTQGLAPNCARSTQQHRRKGNGSRSHPCGPLVQSAATVALDRPRQEPLPLGPADEVQHGGSSEHPAVEHVVVVVLVPVPVGLLPGVLGPGRVDQR